MNTTGKTIVAALMLSALGGAAFARGAGDMGGMGEGGLPRLRLMQTLFGPAGQAADEVVVHEKLTPGAHRNDISGEERGGGRKKDQGSFHGRNYAGGNSRLAGSILVPERHRDRSEHLG